MLKICLILATVLAKRVPIVIENKDDPTFKKPDFAGEGFFKFDYTY